MGSSEKSQRAQGVLFVPITRNASSEGGSRRKPAQASTGARLPHPNRSEPKSTRLVLSWRIRSAIRSAFLSYSPYPATPETSKSARFIRGSFLSIASRKKPSGSC